MMVKTQRFKYRPGKTTIKLDPSDANDLDYTLAPVILAGLLELRGKLTKLVPQPFLEELNIVEMPNQTSFEFYDEAQDLIYDLALQEWEKAVEKMIWAFFQITIPHSSYLEIVEDETQVGYLVGKRDVSGEDLHQKRIDEGILLFGKYYRNLWG